MDRAADVLQSPPDRPRYARAAMLGCGWGLASACVGTLCALLLQALLPRTWLGPSAAAFMADYGNAGLFWIGVVGIPLSETLTGQLLPMEIARRLGSGKAVCILASAALFVLGHYLNGGLAHGIVTFLCGAIFARAYWGVRHHGYLPSCWSAYTAHMTHNFLLIFILGPLLPQLD